MHRLDKPPATLGSNILPDRGSIVTILIEIFDFPLFNSLDVFEEDLTEPQALGCSITTDSSILG